MNVPTVYNAIDARNEDIRNFIYVKKYKFKYFAHAVRNPGCVLYPHLDLAAFAQNALSVSHVDI